jgi:DNA-binding NtrC family response regulator
MTAYGWPGNVRQLKRAVLGAAQLASGGIIRPEELPDDLMDGIVPVARGDVAMSQRQRTIVALQQSAAT